MNVGKESEYLENKESLAQKRKGLVSLTAMLNKHGHGEVYFGVADDGEVLNYKFNDKSVAELRTEIRDYIKPPIVPEITLLEDKENKKQCIKVSASGKSWPYSAYGEYRVRTGQEDCQIDPLTIRKMSASSINDPLKNFESDNQSLTFDQLRSLLASRVKLGNESQLARNEGFINDEGKFNLEGKLFSDNNDFSMKVTLFSGYDKSEITSRNEFGYRCLALSIQEILSFVSSLNKMRTTFKEGVREDLPLFDFNAFREAFINACLHSRWQENTPPNVFIFNNRIMASSFGGLPYGLSLNDFYDGRQMVVNKGIQRILSQLGYVEQTGYGVPYILHHIGKEAFSISDNFVDVTIPFNYSLESNQVIRKKGLSRNDELILEVLKDDPDATKNKLADELKVGLTSISTSLSSLKNAGYIKRVGGNKTGYWAIMK